MIDQPHKLDIYLNQWSNSITMRLIIIHSWSFLFK